MKLFSGGAGRAARSVAGFGEAQRSMAGHGLMSGYQNAFFFNHKIAESIQKQEDLL